MSAVMPARRRVALHGIRLASMRLDKSVSAETFAQTIEALIQAARDDVLEGQTEKPAAPDPDPPGLVERSILWRGTPDSGAPSPASPPVPVRRGRGGLPKLSLEQKAELQRRYREVTRDREQSPPGWAKAQAAEFGVCIGTIYRALLDEMADKLVAAHPEVIGPRPQRTELDSSVLYASEQSRVREIEGTYGNTAPRERGPMA